MKKTIIRDFIWIGDGKTECSGRKCWDAEGDICTCKCHGIFHGINNQNSKEDWKESEENNDAIIDLFDKLSKESSNAFIQFPLLHLS